MTDNLDFYGIAKALLSCLIAVFIGFGMTGKSTFIAL